MANARAFSTRYPVSRRVAAITASATKQMAVLAARVGGCVSLGQGVPSFPTPIHIVEAVTKLLREDPDSGKYSLQSGMAALRNRIAEYLRLEKDIHVDPENEICVTVGGMEALLATVMTVVDEGDEVILPTPTYASYIEQVLLAGGRPRYVPLTVDWGLDMEAIRSAVTPATRAIMICNPGNPTGTVFPEDEMFALCRMAVASNVVVIIDEAYDYIVYDGAMPRSPLCLETFRDHVISINSFSKKYGLTGWRVGWVAAAAGWMQNIMKVHDATAICAPTPSQHAALAALEGDQGCVGEMCKKLRERKRICCARLDSLRDYFSYVPPKGAFYVMAKYLFSDAPSEVIATRMLKEAKVITIPGGAFGPGGEGHLRISFGAEPEIINEAFDRIERWLERTG
ncbi:MAG: pyridoxal phosphate-dependent aminotransferase [Desulforhopalus sp.]